jgi:hypothetical protein
MTAINILLPSGCLVQQIVTFLRTVVSVETLSVPGIETLFPPRTAEAKETNMQLLQKGFLHRQRPVGRCARNSPVVDLLQNVLQKNRLTRVCSLSIQQSDTMPPFGSRSQQSPLRKFFDKVG